MTKNRNFPSYGNCSAKAGLDDLFRLLSPGLFDTDYIDARSAAALVATGLQTFRICKDDPRWQDNPILHKLNQQGHRLNMVAAALFDLVCNAEYLHGRITNRSWIYCNRDRGVDDPTVHAYYCFLKQCPNCCQDRGLGSGCIDFARTA